MNDEEFSRKTQLFGIIKGQLFVSQQKSLSRANTRIGIGFVPNIVSIVTFNTKVDFFLPGKLHLVSDVSFPVASFALI